jgi:Na+-driven multidrug efflux pump
MFIPCQGFNNGVGTFTGQNMGAGNIDRVISGMKKTLKIVVPLAFVLAAALFLFAGPLVSVFGVMDDALELGEMHLHFIAPFFVLFTAYMVFAGVLTGSGDVLASTSITLSGLALRVICANVFCYVFRWGFRSLYYAIPVGWVLCFILALVRYFGGKWKSKALVKHGRPDEA